ncbi:hypothetical protein NHX12_004850 [Muraenolepis orangiensis]|uniref:Uncharacterized protein n=1 Tax=Muraenolepis orangiensis TaxID=630683 RepID=A0A9Q0DZV7_9TELE|nr:hypothetical protein NHX12_004850 [Muraenolepis orangiensis]
MHPNVSSGALPTVAVCERQQAVTTAMELYEATSPSNRNVTARIEGGLNVMPQVRDLVITATFCFTGGVGLTVMVGLICYRVSVRREREREGEGGERPEEHSSPWGRQKQPTSHGDGRKPRDRQADISDPRAHRSKGAGDFGSHFRCPQCGGAGLGDHGGRPGGKEDETLVKNKRVREEEGEERRSEMHLHQDSFYPNMTANGGPGYPHPGARPPQGILRPYKTGQEPGPYRTLGDLSGREPGPYRTLGDLAGREQGHSRTLGDLSGREPGHYRTLGDLSGREPGPYGTHGDLAGREPGPYRTHEDPAGREQGRYEARAAFERQGCDRCHQTYEHKPEDLTSSQERPPQARPGTRGWEVEDEGADGRSKDRRGRRNVTFYLERPLDPRRRSGDKERRTREKRGEGGKTQEGRHKTRGQSSRLLKVKLNLSPVHRNKVHPWKSSERRRSEERSSRGEERGGEGRKENRLDGKEDKGGGRKGKSDEAIKSKSTKTKKSAKEDPSDEKRPEDGQNKKTSTDSVETTDQSEPSKAPGGVTHTNGQRVNMQLVPPPFSASVSLLGIPSTARPVHSLSLHANVAYQGLRGLNQNMAVSQSLALQRGLHPSASAASLLAVPGRSHPPLGRSVSTPSIYASPSGGLASGLNPTMSPAHIIQSLSRTQLSPENIPLVPRPTAENIPLVPRPTAENMPLVPRPTAENMPLVPRPSADPPQGPGLQSGEEPHALTPVAGIVGTGPSGDAGGGDGGLSGTPRSLGGGLIAAAQSADVATIGSVCSGQTGAGEGGVTSAPVESTAEEGVVSSSGGVVTAGSQALLQQEYLSEDGGSSPKRKLKLILPEKASSRPPTALERKIR